MQTALQHVFFFERRNHWFFVFCTVSLWKYFGKQLLKSCFESKKKQLRMEAMILTWKLCKNRVRSKRFILSKFNGFTHTSCISMKRKVARIKAMIQQISSSRGGLKICNYTLRKFAFMQVFLFWKRISIENTTFY